MPTTHEIGSRSRDKRCSSSLGPVLDYHDGSSNSIRCSIHGGRLSRLASRRLGLSPSRVAASVRGVLRIRAGCSDLSPPGSPLENGLVLCEVRSRLTGNRLVSIPFSDHCEPLINDLEELELFVENLAERIEKSGWKYFELRPILHTPNDKTNLGISQNYYFHRLDLRPSEQTLFKTFHKDSVQRKIRRAEREGLRYEEGTSEAFLQHFYKLMITTRRRQGLPPNLSAGFAVLLRAWRGTPRLGSPSKQRRQLRAY